MSLILGKGVSVFPTFPGPIFEGSTPLLDDNYTVTPNDYRIDFKITTSTTYRVTLPDPTDIKNVDRLFVVDNHYDSSVGSLVDFDLSVDGNAAGAFTLAPDNSDKLFSDGIEWRTTV